MAPFAERIENLGCGFLWEELAAGAAWSRKLLARESVQATRPPPEFRLPLPGSAIIDELRARLAR